MNATGLNDAASTANVVIAALPAWAEWLTAALVVLAGAVALAGSFGLLRLRSFFQRVHGPALGASLGVWSLSLASAVYFSVQGGQLFVHALLVAVFVSVTTPVTTIFLLRTALFRERQAGGDVPPTVSAQGSAPPPSA